jgi:hypothetical protein
MLRPVLNGLGRPQMPLFNVATDTLVIVTALFIGTQWGMIGVCWAWVVGGTLSFLINLNRSLPVIGVGFWDYVKSLLPAMLAAAAAYAAVFGVQLAMAANGQLLRLAVSILAAVAVYLGLTLLINRPVFLRAFRMLKRT